MSTQVYVGLAVTAHDNFTLNASTFDYVNLTQATASGYIAIDAGGGALGTYLTDQHIKGGTPAATSSLVNLRGVTDPAPSGVYQSARYGTFTYTIPQLKASGLYMVRLHFSENVDTAVGERLFNVAINGTPVLSSFDILGTAGAVFTAVVEQFAAKATAAGQMVIAFTPSATSPDQNAEVDAIELIPIQSGTRILTQPAILPAVKAGQPFSGTVATFVDTDPGAKARDYIATVTWGDGTITTGTIAPDPLGSGYDVIGGHTYGSGAVDSLSVQIQSYDGIQVGLTYSVSVGSPLRSTGSATTYNAVVGSSTGPLVMGTFTDSISPPPPFTASIAWGDGQTSAGSVVTLASSYQVTASHTYAQAGSYVPVVTVQSGGVTLTMKNTTIIVTAAAKSGAAAAGAGQAGSPSAPWVSRRQPQCRRRTRQRLPARTSRALPKQWRWARTPSRTRSRSTPASAGRIAPRQRRPAHCASHRGRASLVKTHRDNVRTGVHARLRRDPQTGPSRAQSLTIPS